MNPKQNKLFKDHEDNTWPLFSRRLYLDQCAQTVEHVHFCYQTHLKPPWNKRILTYHRRIIRIQVCHILEVTQFSWVIQIWQVTSWTNRVIWVTSNRQARWEFILMRCRYARHSVGFNWVTAYIFHTKTTVPWITIAGFIGYWGTTAWANGAAVCFHGIKSTAGVVVVSPTIV